MNQRSIARVLVIEDDVALRFTLEEWLRVEGYDVWTADGFASALRALAEQPVDFVITDSLDVFPLSGPSQELEALKQAAGRVPVLLFTGYVDSFKGAELGLAAVCQKPYFEQVRRALQKLRSQDEVSAAQSGG